MAKQNKNKSRLAPDKWVFDLYISGNTPHSIRALDNLKAFCQKELQNQYHINVIDILLHPEMAENHNIIAIPTIVKKQPEPIQYIIGDFSDNTRMLSKLGLK